ncbi:MAG: AAA family ATPase [Lachnospiraceae bacterium]|nr:AAA family ATPase [Lachnospiraceae bacterium]
MITQQEKDNILQGFHNIQISIERMLSMLQKFEEKKSEVKKILETRFSYTNAEHYIHTLLNRKSELQSLKDFYSDIPTIDNSINNQYKTFLQSEITQFNPSGLHLLQPSSHTQIFTFLDKQINDQLVISPNDNNVISWIKDVPNQYTHYIDTLLDLQCKLHIFDQIKAINGSIVMIGANGSGKSTFARQLNGKLANNIVILSAQHFLHYHKRNTISASGDEIQKVRNFQFNTKLGNDNNYQQLITSDMNDLIDALIAQHTDCALELYDNGNQSNSFLLKTIKLWDKIIEHRHIINDRTGLFVTGNGIRQYDFNQLSDGEKAVFYYIAHILLATDNSYIIVDEPENHLHPTICNKLWDELEKERCDCKFIYLTHNLNFATTRSNCTILWNKKFKPPYDWEFEILPENEIIPEVLIMELIGSRKNICFCEGNNRSSLDYKLYCILFPQYTVIPVSGHRNVIDYVDAYNNISSFITQAVGIIDGDHHLPKQIEKWRQKKIYTLPINEIENILCDDYILQKAIDTFCSSENALETFHDEFWTLLADNIEQQATSYVNEYTNNLFKDNFLHEKQNIATLITELQNITSGNQIQSQYDTTISKINDFIENRDYHSALRFVNFKGRLTKDKARKIIVDKYENRILDLIKKDTDLQKHILETYFSDFNF